MRLLMQSKCLMFSNKMFVTWANWWNCGQVKLSNNVWEVLREDLNLVKDSCETEQQFRSFETG